MIDTRASFAVEDGPDLSFAAGGDWFAGLFGYFPSYTMGAVIAAQLFAALRRKHPDAVEALARGDFAPLLTWLRGNVHGRGRLVSTDQLLVDATGSPLGPDAFKAHLRARYTDA